MKICLSIIIIKNIFYKKVLLLSLQKKHLHILIPPIPMRIISMNTNVFPLLFPLKYDKMDTIRHHPLETAIAAEVSRMMENHYIPGKKLR